MLDTYVKHLIAIYAVVKGMTIAVVLALLDVTFWKSLIIATTSGVIGAAGAITAAVITVREMGKNRTSLGDIKKKIEADKRKSDRKDDN